MEQHVVMVRGRRIEPEAAANVRKLTRRFERVILDLGTGDGRWVYRMAKTHPSWLFLGLDANAERMRDVSFRATRKPARGGMENAHFVLAAAEALPAGLRALADVVHVSYPWGSLLGAVLAPDRRVLLGIAEVLKPCGVLRIAVNAALLDDARALGRVGLRLRSAEELRADAVCGYEDAGFTLARWGLDGSALRSSWAGRLGQGGPVPTLCWEAVKRGDGRDHGGR